MNSNKGKLWLIPVDLGYRHWPMLLPEEVQTTAASIKVLIAERAKSARAFLSHLPQSIDQQAVTVIELNKHEDNDYLQFLKPCLIGQDIGLISEAGMPAVADPGSKLVFQAHQLDIQVVPLVVPSSLFLALAASGLNGQHFTFSGYLPIKDPDRTKAIKQLELTSKRFNQTQIFMETPYRNEALFQQLLKVLHMDTKLCVAANLTHPTEYIQTQTIADWQQRRTPKLAKVPAIFILQAGS